MEFRVGMKRVHAQIVVLLQHHLSRMGLYSAHARFYDFGLSIVSFRAAILVNASFGDRIPICSCSEFFTNRRTASP